MKLLIPISALIFLLCLSQVVRADTVQVDTLTYDYGGLNGFYSIGYHISMGLVPTLKKDLLQKIADLVTDNGGSISDVANDVVKAYAGPIVFMVFGGVLALAAALSCLIICCGRCFCKCCGATDYQPAHEKRTLLYVASFLLFASFAFVLTGAIIYGKAVDDTYDTLRQDAFEDINNIIWDLEALVLNTTAEISDSVTQNIDKTFDATADEINKAPQEMITNFETATGLIVFSSEKKNRDDARNAVHDGINLCQGELKDILRYSSDNEVETLQGEVGQLEEALKALDTVMGNLDNEMESVDDNVAKIEKDLTTSLSESSGKIKSAKDSVTSTTKDITNAINDLHKSLQSVENTTRKWIDDVRDWDGLKAFRSGMQAIGLLPLSIALAFLIIGLVASGVRIARSETKPHQRSTPSHISGGLSVAGIYIGFMVSAFIMVMAVIFFFGGFAVSSVCKPLFRDDAYALYKASDNFDVKVDPYEDNGDNPIVTNIGTIFQECSSRTMFSLLGGEDIINVKEVMKTIDFDELQTEANGQIPEKIWPETKPNLNEVDTAIEAWSKSVAKFQNAKDFLTQTSSKYPTIQEIKQTRADLFKLQTSVQTLSAVLGKYQDAAKTLQNYFNNDKDTHDALSQQVNATFDEVNKTTQDGLQAFIDDLMLNVAQCGPFLVLYDNVGVLVCDHIGRPVHGMWAALGLAALALIPASYSLLLLVRWLLRMDRHYYRNEVEDTGPMIWAGSATSPPVKNAPATINDYSYPINQSLDRLDPIEERFPEDYANQPNGNYIDQTPSQQLHRPDTLYPELGLPRVNRGFEEYSGDNRRMDNWDIPLPEDSPPSTTQRLKRF